MVWIDRWIHSEDFNSIQQNIPFDCNKCRMSCREWSETPVNTHWGCKRKKFAEKTQNLYANGPLKAPSVCQFVLSVEHKDYTFNFLIVMAFAGLNEWMTAVFKPGCSGIFHPIKPKIRFCTVLSGRKYCHNVWIKYLNLSFVYVPMPSQNRCMSVLLSECSRVMSSFETTTSTKWEIF